MKVARDKYNGIKLFLYGFLIFPVGFLIDLFGFYIHQRIISIIGFFIGAGALIIAVAGFGLLAFSNFYQILSYVSSFFGNKKFDVDYINTKDTSYSTFKISLITIFFWDFAHHDYIFYL